MNRKHNLFSIAFLLLILSSATALLGQGVGIHDDNSNPDTSAMLDLKSTNKGTSDNFQASVEDIVYDNGTSGTPEVIGVVNRTWHIEEEVSRGSDVSLIPRLIFCKY